MVLDCTPCQKHVDKLARPSLLNIHNASAEFDTSFTWYYVLLAQLAFDMLFVRRRWFVKHQSDHLKVKQRVLETTLAWPELIARVRL